MKIDELMTKDVVTVTPEASLKEVARLLIQHGISGMPVLGADGSVVGVISEHDILHKERGRLETRGGPLAWLLDGVHHADVVKAQARTAAEEMTQPAITIASGSPASTAAWLMVERRVNRLPVVDRAGRLVGIVSRADLVRAFIRSDEEIAREIREDVLKRALWVDPNSVEVTVRDGEVELAGQLATSTDVLVLEKLVEKIPGVVSVRSTVEHRIDDSRRAGRYAAYR